MAEKIVLGLSGGMDSAFAALKLIAEGYDVIGVNIVMKDNCDCSLKASMLAEKLGISFHVVDARADFERFVILPFVDAYVHGLTPNPCVLCNPSVKLKQLFDAADKLGARYVATGHYSVPVVNSGRYSLAPAKDAKKDQGYFLYGLTQDMLSRLVLPLGTVLKSEIKEFFNDRTEYLLKSETESTDICFVEKGKYASVVEEYCDLPPCGKFVDQNGQVLGEHKGIHCYTVGQRKGLGIALGAPAYVREINPTDNTVVLSFDSGVRNNSIMVGNINYLATDSIDAGTQLQVRTRYRAAAVECVVNSVRNDCIEVAFCNEAAIAAPGQSAVFYDENGYIAFGGEIIR